MTHTQIMQKALRTIGDLGCTAQGHLAPDEIERLDAMQLANLIHDAERALHNTRIAVQNITDVLHGTRLDRG